MNKKASLYIFISLVALYIAVAFTTPTDPQVLERYHLTQTGVRLLNLTVVGPLAAIWSAAFYGYAKIRNYAASLTGSAEENAFRLLSNGMFVSVMSLPVAAIIGAILSFVALRHSDLLPETTIARNYLNLGFALVTFYLIGGGAELLVHRVQKRHNTMERQAWTIAFIVIASLFTWLVTSHHPSGHDRTYYLPDWLTVLTIVVPYLYVWYRGFRAAACIYFYQRKVKGLLYKQALSFVSIGVAAVIATSVLIQFLTVFGERLQRLRLTPILMLVYLLVALYAVGYGLIAKGAKRLKTIEDA
jgi:hypothetical protein